MDGVQFTFYHYISSQKFLVFILSTSKGWNSESALEAPNGFEQFVRMKMSDTTLSKNKPLLYHPLPSYGKNLNPPFPFGAITKT